MADSMPAPNMHAQQHADPARPAPTGAPAANNNQAPPLVANGLQNHRGNIVRSVDAELDDIISNGLYFLDQARTNPALGIDDKFRQLLLDPVPSEAKPLKIVGEIIPEEVYRYFYVLTFNTNKTLTTLCIWLDLFTQRDIYISFSTLCAIQERLCYDYKDGFGWVEGKWLSEQPEQIRHYSIGVMACTKMLEVWSKTEYGKALLQHMELVIEDKLPGAEEEKPADKLLSRLEYNDWKGYLGEDRGYWLVLINQRYQ